MRVLDSMIGWLAPPVCVGCGGEGYSLCQLCTESEILPFGSKCWHCGSLSKNAAVCTNARRNGSPRFVWISTDYENSAKRLIQAYKFSHQRAAASAMAELMTQTFFDYNSDDNIKTKNYLIIPVPTATSRIRQRSFDHTALLARELGYKLKLPIGKHLARIGQSRQVGSKRNERLLQLEDKFYVKNPDALIGRHILLVDDVITTGATISTISTTLRNTGVKSVSALVFAKKL